LYCGKDGKHKRNQGEESRAGQEESQEVPEDAEARFGGEVARRQEQLRARLARPGAQGACAEGGAGAKALPQTHAKAKNADQDASRRSSCWSEGHEVKAKGKGGRGGRRGRRTNG